MLNGYIDRVWNNGFAYGSSKLHHKRVSWIGLAGAPAEHFEKREYDTLLANHLNIGISNYAGISNSKVEILYNTLDSNPEHHHHHKLLSQAYELGRNFGHQ